MICRCSWCSKAYGVRAGEGVTHGICEPCYAMLLGDSQRVDEEVEVLPQPRSFAGGVVSTFAIAGLFVLCGLLAAAFASIAWGEDGRHGDPCALVAECLPHPACQFAVCERTRRADLLWVRAGMKRVARICFVLADGDHEFPVTPWLPEAIAPDVLATYPGCGSER